MNDSTLVIAAVLSFGTCGDAVVPVPRTVTVRVTDDRGQSVAGAVVRLEASDPTVAHDAATDRDGSATLRLTPPGTDSQLTITAAGCTTLSRHETLPPAEHVTLTAALTCSPPAASWQPTLRQLTDLQGDLMLWVPGLGVPPGTAGSVPRGLQAGWVWSLTTPTYGPDDRARIYQAATAAGYTHFTLHVARCVPGGGYHGLFPVTADDCARHADQLNTALRELWARRLIPVCAGVGAAAGPEPGLDASLCPIVMDDWDDTDKKDCSIDALAAAFPAALIYVEVPNGAFLPQPDRCTPSGLLPGPGGPWLQAVQRRAPHFTGVLYESNRTEGLAKQVAALMAAHPFWRDVQEVLFETDTYWKFWDGIDAASARQQNDAILAHVPWLHGCFSGCTTHPAANRGGD